MDHDLLRKVLSKCKKNELIDIVRKWGHISNNEREFRELENDASKTKKSQVADIVRLCVKRKVDQEAAEELDLLYLCEHSRSKLWSVYQIQRAEGTVHKSSTPNTFRNEFQSHLQNFFDTSVSVLHKGSSYWLRISMRDGSARGAGFVCYFIYHPQADYLIATGVQKAIIKYVLQAFVNVANGTKATDIQLNGRCVKSLAQLTIGKHHQGLYSKYALNQEDGTALRSKSTKRKRQDDEDEFVLRVINENHSEKRRRISDLDELYGPNELPTLEKVTFQCQTDFGGVEHAPNMAQHRREIFQCTVKFEGPSVLEGLRNLAKAGLADFPMRKHLTSIHQKARNTFLIQKRQPQSNMSQRTS